jgi:hypothetical protein
MGIKLAVAHLAAPMEPDQQLSLVLANKACAFARMVRLRVTHCSPADDGSHIIGGTFSTVLGDDDLKALAQGWRT